MQTFLPYNDFKTTAQCLDRLRLGKQRVECLQIANALERGPGAAWFNHPAVRMWRGHGHYLCVYWQAMVDEWLRRGYTDTTSTKLKYHDARFLSLGEVNPPHWLGDKRLHDSHQSRLMQKDPSHYRFDVPFNLNYWWPI